jgi:hypothetical protein
MARLSPETTKKLSIYINSLPPEIYKKCALCNETLTHFVKQAEAKSGAGTASVTRALAEKVNEGAPPADCVSPGALRQRVLNKEGAICRNPTNKPEPDKDPSPTHKRPPRQKPYAAENFVVNISERYRRLFNELEYYIAGQKKEGWPEDKPQYIEASLNNLIDFLHS